MSSKEEPTIIIIKKRRRGGHDEGHGGAWKVAFADFAIAMMAFFMVMWIMEIATQDERQQIQFMMQKSSVFNEMDNIFDISNSPFPIDFGGEASPFDSPALSRVDGNNKLGNALHEQLPNGEHGKGAGDKDKMLSMIQGKYLNAAELATLAKTLSKMLNEMAAGDNIAIEAVPQGLRIVLHDNQHRYMFRRGSAQITPFFKDMLYSLAPVLGRIKNRLVISGYTDATRYVTKNYNNWDLSGERALKARQLLVDSGLPDRNVLQVAAMSDRMPIDPKKPDSGLNRRIEILVLTKDADKQLIGLFGHGPNSKPPGSAISNAKRFAEENQPVSRLEVMTGN
ncbi:OmpA family protein [Parasalinivibrio latis]|uniref:flagellar motor protein MotB n=1 Tax=Parasalinivibrio latis TaxID=2952610 RepID=UPI0030E57477